MERRRHERFEVIEAEGATVFRSRARRPSWRWIGGVLIALSAAARLWLAAGNLFAFFLVFTAWCGFGLLFAEAIVETERPRGQFLHADEVRIEDASDDGGYRSAARPPSVVVGKERWAQDDIVHVDVGRRGVQKAEKLGDATMRTAASRYTVQLVFPDRVVQLADLLQEHEAEVLTEELKAALRVRVDVHEGQDEDVLESHHVALGVLGLGLPSVIAAALMVPPAGRTWLAALAVVVLAAVAPMAVLLLRGGKAPWDRYARRRFALERQGGARLPSVEERYSNVAEEELAHDEASDTDHAERRRR